MSNSLAEPLISIALCTFNGDRYLGEQLDSLLAQTYSNIEIIAVDDASIDGTVEILNEYARRDQRIKVLVNNNNVGFRSNFERALMSCSGAYVAPCDQDDIWLLDKLEVLMAALADRSMAYCDSELINAEGKSLGVRVSDKLNMISTDNPLAFLFANCASGHAMLFRSELLASALPVPDAYFHDWWLATVAAADRGVVFADHVLVKYRQHGANVTSMLGAAADVAAASQGNRSRASQSELVGARICCLAKLAGRHQAAAQRLLQLWQTRETAWLTPGLALFMWRNGMQLHAVQKRSPLKLLLSDLKYLWGMRLKKKFV